MKKNPCFLIVTLSVLLFSNSCKKEKVSKNEFDIFVGNWSCTNYFESSYGRNSPTIGYSYTFSNGQLIYNSKYPDSTGNFIYNTDNFEFKSEITTQLVNSSTLIIHERYTGVNNNGVVKVFEYNNF
ncbi:MAG: hypothetical protein PSX81_01550 [bacterium]|nr:hypothetical protein [bacterium]